MAPSARFERARYGLEARCSVQLSYEGEPSQATRGPVPRKPSPATGFGDGGSQGPRSLTLDAFDPVVQEVEES